MFLVDAETGDIVYTVGKENDYATNLLNGLYSNQNIARAFLSARKLSNTNDVVIVDFEPYEPSNGEPAAFIATPIATGSRITGVLIAQLSIEEIKEYSRIKGVFDGVGESYLVGPDLLMRTDSDFFQESTILKEKVDTPAVRMALEGKSGSKIFTNYRGVEVLGSYAPINAFGLDWALVVEMDFGEAIKTGQTLVIDWLIIMVLVVLLTSATSLFLSRHITGPIQEAVDLISETSHQIASSVEQQERMISQQSGAVNETSSTISELTVSFSQIAEQSESVSAGGQKALELAKSGAERSRRMVESMEDLKSKMSTVADQILTLSEHTHQIGNITSMVSDIASQTNMLALNAAVEAARAGENGRGFSVVAAEIRKLADQSRKSAEQIHSLIMDIQKSTDSTVMATDEGAKMLEECLQIAQKSSESFEGVSHSMGGIFENTQQISLSVKQQALAAKEVSQAMNDINGGARENAASVLHLKTGMDQVNKVAKSLEHLVKGTEK